MKYETEQQKTVRRLAWRVYRYFEKNEDLLRNEDNLILYKKAKAISICYFSNGDDNAAEKAIALMASIMNECDPDDFEPTSEIAAIILA